MFSMLYGHLRAWVSMKNKLVVYLGLAGLVWFAISSVSHFFAATTPPKGVSLQNQVADPISKSEPASSSLKFQQWLTEYFQSNLKTTNKRAIDEADYRDEARIEELPDVCSSGLPGFDLSPIRESDIYKDVAEIASLIRQPNKTTPAHSSWQRQQTPNKHFPQQQISAIEAEASANVRLVSGNSDEWPSQSADFQQFNPHARATASKANTSQRQVGGGATTQNPHAPGKNAQAQIDYADPHAEVFSKTLYPSATQCAVCHQQIYQEWASSGHAYAAVSPMFQRFEDAINKLTQGTIGYFCMRCHAPVATTMGLRRDQAIWDGPRVFREGVTCVACHRVKENYTKVNGERRIEPGDIYEPVFSGSGESGTEIVAKYKDYFKVKTDPFERGPGQPMHRRSIKFEQLSQSDFCMSCHQVAVQPGIKLEVVWDQYRASPAYRDGITCQDCHMGIVPGKPEGYSIGPAAVVNNRAIMPERKHSNHMFYGPGHSVAHPGVFPDNPKTDRWTFNQWLQFDWRAGWGTDEFEDAVSEGRISMAFPPAWSEVDDRYDARELIDQNLRSLSYKKDLRRQVLENGSKIDGPFFAKPPTAGKALRFHYCVTNLNSGHNMPSGSLGAQPQLWLNVVLIDPDGCRVWETGYLDSVGDLADLHSKDVLARRVPLDKQLFNLQSKFLTTNVKGTDREMYIPINFDIDQLPFIRPAPQPVTVLNHPQFIRMEAHSIPPLGSRKAKYVVPAHVIKRPGTYRLSVRMRSRGEPIYFMKFVESTPEMIRMMNEGIVDVHVGSVIFEVQ